MDTYEQVLEKIESSHRFGKEPGVVVSAQMLQALGHPEKGMPFVHVAGTNGKGSTCAFLNRILQNAGLKVGLFTSPHLIDFRERITVNDVPITKEDVERIGNRLLQDSFGYTPTMFDYCLMMAICYFKEQNCDILIIETGLGGRLDSTNALGKPLVSVITRIGYDHMAILGNTLAEIAGEKAGIIKEETPVVMANQSPEAEAVLRKAAGKVECVVVGEKEMEQIKSYHPRMDAWYQRENAALARACVLLLWKYHRELFFINEEELCTCIEKGIHDAFWPGRMEVLSTQPFFLVDGAHNSNGVKALKDSLVQMFPGETFRFLMGVMADKDYEEMVDILLPIADSFVTVTPESSRALKAEELEEKIRSRGVRASSLKKLEEIPSVLSAEKRNIAMGSLYFIGDIKALWDSLQPCPKEK